MSAPSREMLFGWGRANHARSLVYRPSGPDEAAEAVRDARRRGLTVAHRGAGQSYGDAALNQGGAVLQTVGLDRILHYDPEGGRIRAEAGVTVDRLWRHVVADGWWPPVVPGTSRPTLGGCLAMNVHGKNHMGAGSFAEHVRWVAVLGPDGEVEEHTRDVAGLDGVAGAQGTSGTILALEIELKRVNSGYLGVEARTAASLDATLQELDTLAGAHEHAVAWVDCFSAGDTLGRAELHAASDLDREHPRADEGLSVEEQAPDPRALGLLPRDRLASVLRLAVCDPGIRALNRAKYVHARAAHPSSHLEPRASFHFLLDYVPGWRRAYGPAGLMQYQFFVPEARAGEVFRRALQLQHERDVVSYLGVLKRHREDPFPAGYSVDGYSLALDFPVGRRLTDLMGLLREYDRLQEWAGGRIYAAKDSMSRLGAVPPGGDEVYSSNLLRRWKRTASA